MSLIGAGRAAGLPRRAAGLTGTARFALEAGAAGVCAGFINKGQLFITHCWIRFAVAVKNIHYKCFLRKHHLIVVNTILNTNIITSLFVLFAEILQYKLNYEGQIENTSFCALNNKNN